YLGGDGGLYVSEDFGRTWEKLGVLGSVQCILLSRYFDAEPIVLVGTQEGLLRSENAGRTFQAPGRGGRRVRGWNGPVRPWWRPRAAACSCPWTAAPRSPPPERGYPKARSARW